MSSSFTSCEHTTNVKVYKGTNSTLENKDFTVIYDKDIGCPICAQETELEDLKTKIEELDKIICTLEEEKRDLEKSLKDSDKDIEKLSKKLDDAIDAMSEINKDPDYQRYKAFKELI